MSELEERLDQLLKDPNMMQQLMTMAQALGGGMPSQQPAQEPAATPLPDPTLLQGLMGIAQQGNMDQDQQTLLHALSPYLSRERVGKLERAMRAARLAGVASSFLNAGGLRMLAGR